MSLRYYPECYRSGRCRSNKKKVFFGFRRALVCLGHSLTFPPLGGILPDSFETDWAQFLGLGYVHVCFQKTRSERNWPAGLRIPVVVLLAGGGYLDYRSTVVAEQRRASGAC